MRAGRAAAAAAPPTAPRRTRAGLVALGALGAVFVALAALPATPGSRLIPATVGGSPGWLLGPLRPLGLELASGPGAGALFYAGLWLALIAYAIAVRRARDIPRRVAAAAIVGLGVLYLLAPPLLSQDVFSYLAYARLGALHGLDPYAVSPLAAPVDPVFVYAGSKGASSVYGAPFTLATYLLAAVSVPVAFWVMKLVAAACFLAASTLVWRAAERRGIDPRGPTLLVALNPALLVHVVAGAHNEALLLLATAGALLAYGSGRRVGAAGLATAATAVKASAALLVPFLVAGARRGGRPSAATAALAAAAVALGVLAIGVAGFGVDSWGWLDAVRANQARTSSLSLPYKTAELLAAILPGERLDYRAAVRAAYALAFVAGGLWLLRRTWRGADAIAAAGWATLLLLLCSAWLVPWYVAWLAPLAALGGDRRLELATVALTAWTLAIAIPF